MIVDILTFSKDLKTKKHGCIYVVGLEVVTVIGLHIYLYLQSKLRGFNLGPGIKGHNLVPSSLSSF